MSYAAALGPRRGYHNAEQYNSISHSLQADAVIPALACASKPLFGG